MTTRAPSTDHPAASTRILLVDDSDDATFFMSSLLKLHGCEVVTAATGEQGLSLARQQPFDAVVLDIDLPDMLGTELAQRLRDQQQRGVPLRLIALSGHGPDSPLAQCIHAHVDAYLPKPVELPDLLAAITQAGTGQPGRVHNG